MLRICALLAVLAVTVPVLAADDHGGGAVPDLTGSTLGILAVIVFVLTYSLVPIENVIHLRKSKPVLFAAGIIWILVAIAYDQMGDRTTPHDAIKHSLLEYGELFLFLLSAMTYINSLEERNVFQALRAFLVSRGFSLRQVFWATGALAFVMSPIADNLTTALVMGAVVMAVGGSNRHFVVVACINVVVAANAGGAFSPFGDITTLMVWQKGKIDFLQFLHIFFPSLVNWLVPAVFMSLTLGKELPEQITARVRLKLGAKRMIFLFLVTISCAVSFHSVLHLPPAAGMMFGLGLLGFLSYYVKFQEGREAIYDGILGQGNPAGVVPIHIPGGDHGGLSRTMEQCPYPALAIDEDHKITHWNKAMEELTGAPASEMIGSRKAWSPFYDEERPILADLVVDDEPDEEFERRYAGRYRRSTVMETRYDGVDYFPKLDKWFGFSASPVRDENGHVIGAIEVAREVEDQQRDSLRFDLMSRIAGAEWDTLLFFYGIILCVGGLSQFGYLAQLSSAMYEGLGPTIANTLVGVLSAILDNIPVMFAVLTMDPPSMAGNDAQWLLVTLTAGVGGSMLAIGSAAGVALLGTARGKYTFGAHLKWTPVIALGYAASIGCHLLINGQ